MDEKKELIKQLPRELRRRRISKIIVVSLILILLGVVGFALAPQIQNQAQNVTYLPMGEKITLQAQGFMPYNPTQAVSPAGLDTPEGIAWNGSHYFIVDRIYNNVTIYDSGWNLVSNCYIGSGGLTNPSGIATIAGSPKMWVTFPDLGIIGEFYHNCTQITTYSLSSPCDTPSGIDMNDTSNFYITTFWGNNFFCHLNSTFGVIDSCNLSQEGVDNPEGITIIGDRVFVVDSTDDQIYVLNLTCGLLYNFTTDGTYAGNATGIEAITSELLNIIDHGDDKVYNFSIAALDDAVLAVNISGTWENVSVEDMGGASAPTTATFSFSNDTVCNRVVEWRIYFNDSLGNWGSTPIKKFYAVPYLKVGSGTLTCKNKNNVTLTQTGAQDITLYMGFFQRNATFKECSYTCDNCDTMNITNGSTYCIVNATTKSATSVRFDEGVFIKAMPPANLPAALAGSLAVIVIVIYTYTTRKKITGW